MQIRKNDVVMLRGGKRLLRVTSITNLSDVLCCIYIHSGDLKEVSIDRVILVYSRLMDFRVCNYLGKRCKIIGVDYEGKLNLRWNLNENYLGISPADVSFESPLEAHGFTGYYYPTSRTYTYIDPNQTIEVDDILMHAESGSLFHVTETQIKTTALGRFNGWKLKKGCRLNETDASKCR